MKKSMKDYRTLRVRNVEDLYRKLLKRDAAKEDTTQGVVLNKILREYFRLEYPYMFDDQP